MMFVSVLVAATAIVAPELPPANEPVPPVESAPPPTEAAPVQRPSTMPPPSEAPPPTAVETPPITAPPVTTPPVESPPQPIDVPEQAAPPPATTAPAPAPRIEAPLATPDPFVDHEREMVRPPISPAFRRPGVWLGTGFGLFGLATVLRFILPSVARCKARPTFEGEEQECLNFGPALAVSLISLPVETMTLVSFGFAGRSYGLRDARAPGGAARRRGPFIGAGVAFTVAGVALTFAGVIRPLVREDPDAFSYEIAAVRQAGIVAGAAGAFLLGYGIAQPRQEYAAKPRERRFALAPAFGRSYVGVSLAFRR
jgi:hypothetical protein